MYEDDEDWEQEEEQQQEGSTADQTVTSPASPTTPSLPIDAHLQQETRARAVAYRRLLTAWRHKVFQLLVVQSSFFCHLLRYSSV